MRNGVGTGRSKMFTDGNPVAAYLKEISGGRKLSTKAEKILAVRIRKGDRAAMNALVQANLKFVVAVCHNYENQGLPLGDLINEGNLGLLRAAARFDENQGCRFISYAVWWIRQGILNALAEQSRDVTLSTATTAAIHRIEVANRNLTQKLGRAATLEELELETGLKASRIKACQELTLASLSLDYPSEGGEGTCKDSLADESWSRTEDILERFQTRRALDTVLKGLGRRERLIIESLFGLGQEPAMTLMGLAQRLGVSKERVRQLKAAALAKLKTLLLLTATYPCVSPHSAY